MNKNVRDRKNFQHGECKKNSVDGGKNVPVFTVQADFSIPVIQFSDSVTVYNAQIWLHFKIFKLDYFSARVTILYSIRLSSMKSS
jgi:hypothetical protein